jgi:hypothetical protein
MVGEVKGVVPRRVLELRTAIVQADSIAREESAACRCAITADFGLPESIHAVSQHRVGPPRRAL